MSKNRGSERCGSFVWVWVYVGVVFGRGKALEFEGFERFWVNEIVIVSGVVKE